MLKPTYVAEQIVKAMQTKKREVNLPKWMGIGRNCMLYSQVYLSA